MPNALPPLDHQNLHYEIQAAIYPLINANDSIYWISTGIINEKNEIEWDHFVNRCIIKTNALCCDDCTCKKNLLILGSKTMQPESPSLGRVSLDNFQEYGEYPILLSRACGFLKSHLKHLFKVKTELMKKKTSYNSDYEKFFSYCVPSDSVVALVPLVHTVRARDLAYIGAVVICALERSTIWIWLLQIKGAALSLLETHRNIGSLFANKAKNHEQILLNMLAVGGAKNPPFIGNCSVCQEQHSLHEKDCRIEKFGFFGTNQPFLQKSLFYRGKEENFMKNCPSSLFPLENMTKFINAKFNINLTSTVNKMIAWPIQPGLITMLLLIRFLSAAEVDEGEILLEESTGKESSGIVSIVVDLDQKGKEGPGDLLTKLFYLLEGKNLGHVGTSTPALRDLIFADFRSEKHCLTTKGLSSDKLYNPVPFPVVFPLVADKKLYLSWRTKTQRVSQG